MMFYKFLKSMLYTEAPTEQQIINYKFGAGLTNS